MHLSNYCSTLLSTICTASYARSARINTPGNHTPCFFSLSPRFQFSFLRFMV
ncbi:uncharacterized protein LACBIDRAFT_301531 [Laccaria bicolor S238N-H82]|uniref:Predicted protein n=1 Tax=Laccaria bicolor (strain S238N-H82 / ATCC MYA-4686) TaxID=486041 RepID=B0CNR5_LACBS|nr:uncharacterized protein LACBIDRAFT_301531 [Laccaria bicolor S238N-H82]EDR15982.1 predicted protein [Laccaria bicolor S238N-H82]|eukprot:XP_001874190.1 predicted protein [Laccaria bicolor S238N-H82]